MDIGRIDTGYCTFDPERKTLHTYSEAFAGAFPRRVVVKSLHTGREVTFQPIGPDHPQFCHDGWDGEMQIYRPVEPLANVKTLVITHAY